MEPVNLVIIGDKRSLTRHFEQHGWYRADKVGAISLSKAIAAAVFNRSYRKGPMADSFIQGHHYAMAYERPTRSNTYRRRHHLRLWRTSLKNSGRRIWVGTVSYDRSAGAHQGVLPTHHISPTLSWDEEFLASSLGVKKPAYIKLDRPYEARLNQGDPYDYDGRALVLDLG